MRRKDKRREVAKRNTTRGKSNLSVKLVIGCKVCGPDPGRQMPATETSIGSGQNKVNCRKCGRVMRPYKRGRYLKEEAPDGPS